MKIFIKIAEYSLLGAGFILLLLPVPWFPGFYDVRFMGWAALVEAALIYFLPKAFHVTDDASNSVRKNHVVHLFQALLAFSFFVSALGDLGLYQLYKYGIQYDKALHLSIPLAAVFVIALVVQERFEVRVGYAALSAFLFVIFCAVSWEVIEYVADHFLKTHIDGVYGLNVSSDTKLDLLFDLLGSIIGSVLFWHRTRK